jgi:hypothetical protein
MNCDMGCVPLGERYRCECARCGNVLVVRRLPVYALCRLVRGNPNYLSTTVKCLAGTALKSLLASFGIAASPNCPCNVRAAEMDDRGCDWCEENIDTIVGWLREEATKRGLPFLDAAGRLLVKRAIRNARRAAS